MNSRLPKVSHFRLICEDIASHSHHHTGYGSKLTCYLDEKLSLTPLIIFEAEVAKILINHNAQLANILN